MLKRPTSRRKGHSKQIELNLVPILDTLVTLIAFLLFTMTFLNIVGIESPFPIASSEETEQKLQEKPLQLTVTLREKEIWSPFEKIPAKTIPNTGLGQPDIRAIHDALIDVKKQFPGESHVVIVPNASTNYDLLIAVMDTLRVLDPTDPPIFIKNAKTGLDEPAKFLFPDVIFGNLLGDTRCVSATRSAPAAAAASSPGISNFSSRA